VSARVSGSDPHAENGQSPCERTAAGMRSRRSFRERERARGQRMPRARSCAPRRPRYRRREVCRDCVFGPRPSGVGASALSLSNQGGSGLFASAVAGCFLLVGWANRVSMGVVLWNRWRAARSYIQGRSPRLRGGGSFEAASPEALTAISPFTGRIATFS
jgi:hypothetical protein